MTERDTITIGRRSLHHLRAALERTLGLQAAPLLQDTGFASGESLMALLDSFVVARYSVSRPQDLDATYLEEALSGFFAEHGWGTLRLVELHPGILAADTTDWAEAGGPPGSYPSCHVSAGLLADLFSRLAGSPFAAMEVECRTRGDPRCRFLLAAPDTLRFIYERITHGMTYDQAMGR
jgi:predicted hydrocarbon binding protein